MAWSRLSTMLAKQIRCREANRNPKPKQEAQQQLPVSMLNFGSGHAFGGPTSHAVVLDTEQIKRAAGDNWV